MKVAEYHKQGIKNFIEKKPSDYNLLGKASEGIHRIEIYVKTSGNKILDAKFNSSKRCKKLLALADILVKKLKNQKSDSILISQEEVLDIFKEEKDKEKLKKRLSIIMKAINIQ